MLMFHFDSHCWKDVHFFCFLYSSLRHRFCCEFAYSCLQAPAATFFRVNSASHALCFALSTFCV